MKELQEEYCFLNRESINGWEDVFRAKQTVEQRIADIDVKKKELYKEHACYKYQYEKDGDETVYLYHEAHYREQLAELKERRKEAKRECAIIKCCISESTFAHMEIPIDVEKLYMVDVLEFAGSEISYAERGGKVTDYGIVETDEHTELYDKVDISEAELPVIDDILSESDVAVTDSSITEILHEETDMIVEEVYDDINESEIVELPYEPANKLIEAIVEVEGEANLQTVEALDMTKERY